MAEQPTYKFLPEDQCLSQSQLFDYIDGKLTAAEMHMAEKHILSCGFCSDALEGLEMVKDRDKVAAFIPLAKQEEEEEKPKVIPLNPNRKYYALAAAVVLLVAVTFLMRLAFNNEPDAEKMADLTTKDSFVTEPQKENQPGLKMTDSISSNDASGKKDLTLSDQQNRNAGPGDNRKVMPSSTLHNTYPAPVVAEEKAAPPSNEANADGEDRDDFANVVDAEATPEKDKADRFEPTDKVLAKQEQYRAADQKKKPKAAETKNADDNADAKSPAMDETQQDIAVNVPQTTISQAPTVNGASSGATVNSGTSPTYTWNAPTSAGSSTNGAYNTTPNTTITTTADSVATTETETQSNLSYENGVKMLQAGQAAASLAMFDKVLQDPNSANYSDAKWQKAEALIQLKRVEEAKTLLNELAAKPGKYQQKAKDKLKSL